MIYEFRQGVQGIFANEIRRGLEYWSNAMLTGKICIVTGGSRGIGKAISQVFAQNGAIVYATATKEGSVGEWAEKFNEGVKGEVRSLYFDISDESAVKNAVMQVKRTCEHIDGLVNNAGVEFNELIGMISHGNMEKMFSVNVYGVKIGRASCRERV